MFENITTTTVIWWILGYFVTNHLVPMILRSDLVKRAVKVVDRDADVIEDAGADFDWKTTQPVQYRPFKPIYFVTMGIASSKESDYLKIEKTYGDVVKYKTDIADSEPTETCLVASEPDVSRKVAQATTAAVEELYDFVAGYLVKKYPGCFVLTNNIVTNLITNNEFPRYAAKRDKSKFSDARSLLKLLVANVEEDFLIMQFDSQQDNEYALRAATGIGANGFRTSEKMNKKLTDIHAPVPQYIQRLQLSMNRHFHKVQPGEYVQRLTWGIQIGGGMSQLFRPSGQHLAAEEVVEELDGSKIDFTNDAFVRVERQVLSRLPKSKFIVLTVRTYMYPLQVIKKEGSAQQLAKAIRAWPEDVAHYKGRSRWGKAVLEYLEN